MSCTRLGGVLLCPPAETPHAANPKRGKESQLPEADDYASQMHPFSLYSIYFLSNEESLRIKSFPNEGIMILYIALYVLVGGLYLSQIFACHFDFCLWYAINNSDILPCRRMQSLVRSSIISVPASRKFYKCVTRITITSVVYFTVNQACRCESDQKITMHHVTEAELLLWSESHR